MFNHRFDEPPNRRVIFHWFLMSFNGGCINAGGFIATGRFVSHVTGFATIFGYDIMSNQIKAALSILSVPVFFLAGSFIAGLLIDRPIYENRKPHFGWVMSLCALCLLIAAAGSFLNFGTFGDTAFVLKRSYVLLALLCLASGLQNAAITSSSGHSVRTTHLTGLTTDLGLGLARTLAFDMNEARHKKELRANKLRFGSIVSYILGSAIGAFFFIKFQYYGFLLPALIAAYAAKQNRSAKTAPRQISTWSNS
jgi:uncharacterized membrane protein YoaK (UPF0700 family)